MHYSAFEVEDILGVIPTIHLSKQEQDSSFVVGSPILPVLHLPQREKQLVDYSNYLDLLMTTFLFWFLFLS